VKQSDLGEYEENAREKQKIQIYTLKYQLSLKPSRKDDKHQFPSPSRKAGKREKSRGLINISQLSLGIDVSHRNVSLPNVIS
jgi:hypothetical protein